MHQLSMMRTITTITARPLQLLCLATIVLLVAGSSPKDKVISTTGGPRVASMPRHIQYGFTLQNETAHTLDKVDLWTFAPVERDEHQRCESLEASHSHDVMTDGLGNQTLHFVFREVPPYATKIVTVRADLVLSGLPRPGNSRDLDAFLKPEKTIESNDPAIRSLAASLRGSSPFETAERIFTWVAANVRYAEYLPHDRGALYAFKHRKGDCSELAALFAAGCRASGIPARVVGGFVCTGDSVLRAGDYHDWAEFNVEGTWFVADPQRRIFRGEPTHYVAMRVTGGEAEKSVREFRRFRAEGEGVVVSMRQ